MSDSRLSSRIGSLLLCLFVGCGQEVPPTEVHQSSSFSTPGAAINGKNRETWPQIYGLSGQCVAHTPAPLQPDVRLWKSAWSIPAGSGYSAPVGVEGAIFLWDRIADHVRMRRIDLANGDVIWTRKFATGFQCEYSQYSSGPYSTPRISESSVCCISPEGILRALEIQDGNIVWQCDLAKQFDVPSYGYPVGHSPINGSAYIAVNVGGRNPSSCLVAFDRDTGKVVWQAGEHVNERVHGSHGSPRCVTVGTEDYFVAVTSDSILCVHETSGKVHAQWPFGTGSADTPNAATPVVIDDRIVVSGFRADVICLRIKREGGFEKLWANRRSIESSYSPLTHFEGALYGWHAFDRTLRCVQAATGDLLWKKKTIFARGNHILFPNKSLPPRMVALGEDGHLGVIDIDQKNCRILSATDTPVVEGPCYSMPAWISGCLLVRNESQLLCYDLADNR